MACERIDGGQKSQHKQTYLMTKTNRILTLLAILALHGCETQPVSTDNAMPVLAERILALDILVPAAGRGVIVVKRDAGFGGSAYTARVFIDARPAAELKPGERVTLYLPYGDHILSAQVNGLCGGGLAEVKASVNERASMYRIGYGTCGDFILAAATF